MFASSFRLYNRTLSASEILVNYGYVPPPPSPPPPLPPKPPSPPQPPGAAFTAPSGPNHRFLFVTGSSSPVTAASVGDGGAAGARAWNATGGPVNVLQSAPYVGIVLDSTSAWFDLGARDYSLAGLKQAGETVLGGFSAAFWLHRTAAAAASVTTSTALLTLSGARKLSVSVTARPATGAGHSVDLAWPGCAGGAAQFVPATNLSTAGFHHIAVSFSENAQVVVYVDGAVAAYRASSARCDFSSSRWPSTNFAVTNTFLGSYGSVDPSTFALIDAGFFFRPLTAAEVVAAYSVSPVAAVAPPPPPAIAPAGFGYALPQLAACQTRPPIHRYGDFQASPFAGGAVVDANASAPLHGAWRTAVDAPLVPNNAYVTLGNHYYYGNDSYVDLGGPLTLTGTGLTVGILISNSAMAGAPCAPTAAGASATSKTAPSSTAYFSIGNYSAYSTVSSCAAGYGAGAAANAVTYVTTPSATATATGSGVHGSPLVPMVHERRGPADATGGLRVRSEWGPAPTPPESPAGGSERMRVGRRRTDPERVRRTAGGSERLSPARARRAARAATPAGCLSGSRSEPPCGQAALWALWGCEG